MVSPNRRAYYRALIQIPLRWRVLLPDEVQAVRKGKGKFLFRTTMIPTPIDEFIQQSTPGSKEEQIYRCFQLINNKLDFLIGQVLHQMDESPTSAGDLIDISGSGLKFSCHEHIPTGSLVKTDLIIPATSQFRVEIICEVLRIETHQRGYLVACKIMEIDEGTRESIVKVVFQQQRTDIRKTRENQEDLNVD